MTIGETIKQMRKKRKLTQGELALAIGVSTNAIGAWERGEAKITVGHYLAICKRLGYSVEVREKQF